MQKPYYLLLGLILFGYSCKKEPTSSTPNGIDWKDRVVNIKTLDSLQLGKTYLSVYSQIYSRSNKTTHDLTATVSMKNINESEKVYITSAKYYNTKGELIESYSDNPIFINPMETIEVVIDEVHKKGGTGGNFIFEWKAKKNTNPPYFEGVMISTAGQQGLSFTTQGIIIE